MAKIKLTKAELKKQRDALKQYERYLPTLQLKKQQLQTEIIRQNNLLAEKLKEKEYKRKNIQTWSALLAEKPQDMPKWLSFGKPVLTVRNVAGVDLPVFERMDFPGVDYDLFATPLWVDNALEALKSLVVLLKEIATIEEAIVLLRQELRITTQRVNLFEKVKIPESLEAIRVIKIYIGDQMANAVGRSKIAKRKIEEYALEEALV